MKLAKNFITLIFILACALCVLAQSQKNKKLILSPSTEKFEPAFGRIRESVGLGKRFLQDRKETDTIRIYNADGSIWYEFSYYESSNFFYKKNLKSDFKPIGSLPIKRIPDFGIMLKLKAESENWYEVVVNEETQATKYVWKGDPIIGRDTWESYIPECVFITFDKEKNPLRELPDGKIMSVQMPEAQRLFMPGTSRSDINGEWLYVWTGWSKYVEKPIGGWIRWKKDNELLISFWAYEKENSSEINDSQK